MMKNNYYYIVEGEKLPLQLVETVRFISPSSLSERPTGDGGRMVNFVHEQEI